MLPLKITKTDEESGEDINEQSNEEGSKNVKQPISSLVPDRRISRAM